MGTAELMNPADPLFHFIHAMDHRIWIGLWDNKQRPGFSVIPYEIGQASTPNTPVWRYNHQQAHWDALDAPPNPMGKFGPGVPTALWLEGNTKWTAFTNWIEHNIAAQNIAENNWDAYYPFW